MLFNSYEFLLFYLPVVFIVYFIIAKKSWQSSMYWIVVASLAFYGYWDIRYVPLLMASICFNYFMGLQIAKSEKKKPWLITGLLIDFLLLGYFKYTAFFFENINYAMQSELFDIPKIILPLGISFFTFTQSAYLIDSYRGEIKELSFIGYCEFVTIFPHLIAGPIINHRVMIPQFLNPENYKINYDNVAKGLAIFLMGLTKKVAIADGLAPWVNDYFSRPDSLTTIEAWFAAVGYTLQLYFDFSAYSEMAIGLGLMFNLKFPMNFNSPYKSKNIIDFWRRWHMTLGTWVKNYLYIPLGGNRNGVACKLRNLLASMLLIGLWHGAGWTFVAWGGTHGIFLLVNHLWREFKFSMPKVLSWPLTFLAVTCAWVLFRANTFVGAASILHAMFTLDGWTNSDVLHGPNGVRTRFILILLLIVMIMPNPLEIAERHFKPNLLWLLICVLLGCVSLYFFSHVSDFLYFQF